MPLPSPRSRRPEGAARTGGGGGPLPASTGAESGTGAFCPQEPLAARNSDGLCPACQFKRRAFSGPGSPGTGAGHAARSAGVRTCGPPPMPGESVEAGAGIGPVRATPQPRRAGPRAAGPRPAGPKSLQIQLLGALGRRACQNAPASASGTSGRLHRKLSTTSLHSAEARKRTYCSSIRSVHICIGLTLSHKQKVAFGG